MRLKRHFPQRDTVHPGKGEPIGNARLQCNQLFAVPFWMPPVEVFLIQRAANGGWIRRDFLMDLGPLDGKSGRPKNAKSNYDGPNPPLIHYYTTVIWTLFFPVRNHSNLVWMVKYDRGNKNTTISIAIAFLVRKDPLGRALPY